NPGGRVADEDDAAELHARRGRVDLRLAPRVGDRARPRLHEERRRIGDGEGNAAKGIRTLADQRVEHLTENRDVPDLHVDLVRDLVADDGRRLLPSRLRLSPLWHDAHTRGADVP